MRYKLLIGSALTATALAGIAIAAVDRPAVPPTNDALLERLNVGATIEQYTAQVVGELRSADRAGDGLDRGDIDLIEQQQRAQIRASAVAEVLRQDLDGDLKATRSELLLGARGEEPNRTRQVEATLERFDANGDGVITVQEAASSAVENRVPLGERRLEALLALDPNKDGRLTAEELRTLAEHTFASIDSDGDGKLSPAEFAPITERVHAAMLERMAPVCAMPAAPAGASLVVYSAYEATAISSVAVGGVDQETNLTDVVIEPGSAPLYLVLTSYESMVWRLMGATNRVARVVVSSSQSGQRGAIGDQVTGSTGMVGRIVRHDAGPRAPAGASSASGVVGLAAAKVSILGANCAHYFSSNSAESRAAIAPVRRALGREPDAIVSTYSTQSVALPSGTLTKAGASPVPTPTGFDPQMWQEAARYWPSGVVTVDPRQVVASTRVEPYKVLPSQMGLAQLIGAGAIERTPDGKFRIVRPIAHMPPSMGGAHSVSIVLADGVPMPVGSPGHSCVLSEADWRKVPPGQRCRITPVLPITTVVTPSVMR
jgi:hypothetical protein